MAVSRRGFLTFLAAAVTTGGAARRVVAAEPPTDVYDFPPLGNVTLLHFTDTHATLFPVFHREPDRRAHPAEAPAESPPKGSLMAYALTAEDFTALAQKYGRLGGYEYLATLVKRVRSERPGRTLLLDGGSSLLGSATALWTRGEDMILAANRLGVDVTTGHWELTLGLSRVRDLVGDRQRRGLFRGDFVAHNVSEGPSGEGVFHPYSLRDVGGARVAVIGAAHPHAATAHPRSVLGSESLASGVREVELGRLVRDLREDKKAALVVLLSQMGLPADVKVASRVPGIDVILGGHTHDALPAPVKVGTTLVLASGSHGKFLTRLDLDVKDGRMVDYRHRLIPVVPGQLTADPEMTRLIKTMHAPHEARLTEVLATADSLLYRAGVLGGTFDEVILDALTKRADAQVAFSPGLRWGPTILSGSPITLEDVHAHTAIPYAGTWVADLTGAEIRAALEESADHVFHPDPYERGGGDLLRVGGLQYVLDPRRPRGRRIVAMQIGGRPVGMTGRYKATGWGGIRPASGPPAYDVVSAYVRDAKRVAMEPRSRVRWVDGPPRSR